MKTLLSAAIVLGLALSSARAEDAFGANSGGTANGGPNKLQDFMQAADRNGDGKVDVAERAAVSKNMEDFLRKQFAANADTNGDGKIDMSERTKAMQGAEKQRFDWMKSIAGQAGNGGGPANGTSTFGGDSNTSNNPPNNANPNPRDQRVNEFKRRAQQPQQPQQTGNGSFGPNAAQGLNGQLNPNSGANANPNAFGPGGVRPGQGPSFGPPKGKAK